MEKETVIKALECCTRGRKSNEDIPCLECPYNECNIVGGTSERQTSGTCQGWLMKDSIALIEELTKENERLTGNCESYALQYGTATDKEVFLKRERADTVREFAERLKAEAYVPKPYGMSKVVDVGTIDRIADEILNGKEEKNGLQKH